MKKNGFTLIELLAVIVILGVIMVIAIPMVSGYITKSKMEASKDSVDGYTDSVQKSIIGGEISIDNYEGNYYASGKVLTREDGFKFNIDGRNIDGISGDITIDAEGKVVEGYYVVGEYELYYDGTKATVTGLVSQADARKIYVEDNVKVDIEGTHKMVIGTFPSNVEGVEVTWSSSDESIFKIDINGNIIPVKSGEAYVTATSSNGLNDKTKVTIIVEPYETGVTVESGSLYTFINNPKLSETGAYTINLENGTSIEAEVYVFSDDVAYSTTPTLCDNVSDTKMCIYKYMKNLTVNSGVTMTPQVRKKGFTVYVGETLTNSGTISMTARGAIALGQDLILYKNSDSTYEMVPAVGAAGAPGSVYKAGVSGSVGTLRKTGGGGKGSAYTNSQEGPFGSGAAGTSYSGGSGGGGMYGNSLDVTMTPAKPNGGAGGTGANNGLRGGGGAGNPAGYSINYVAEDGTGGLLNIYANSINNLGTINSNGSKGARVGTINDYNGAGAGSGGGSINVFYGNTFNSTGSIAALGGAGGATANIGGSWIPGGGAGGAGSVTIGSIGTGKFISN